MTFYYLRPLKRFEPIKRLAFVRVYDNAVFVNFHARFFIGGDTWKIQKSRFVICVDFDHNILMIERVEDLRVPQLTGINRVSCAGIGQYLYSLGYCIGFNYPYKYIGKKKHGWMFRMLRRKKLHTKWQKKEKPPEDDRVIILEKKLKGMHI